MKLRELSRRATGEARSLKRCVDAGLIRLDPPSVFARGARGIARFGVTGGAIVMAAARYPDRDAVVDELGSLTYADMDKRSNALANAWRELGLRPGDGVAILVRNHRGFLDAVFAAAKCGARTVLLNTDFAGPQLIEVSQREGVDLLVHDDEYSAMVEILDPRFGKFLAWAEAGEARPTLESLIASGETNLPPAPEQQAKVIVLTSGTTGTPKGAQRPEPRSFLPFGGLFGKVPYRSGEVMECCAPMFHALGLVQAMLGVSLGHTLVLRRRFDPQATLDSISSNKVTTLIVVPVMLQKMLALGADARRDLDLSSLRIAFVAGSQLGSDLCVRTVETFGPVVYNLYGSTEVAFATIATPDELTLEPGCVGSVVDGATVRIVDGLGQQVPDGTTGRIFVANTIQTDGYTGGGGKEVVDGLMSSGDVGHFDDRGLLFIDGRDDDMIVSGGENLFPGEVEECLAAHRDIVEAAAIGVPDETYGTRLHAFVVRSSANLDEDAVKAHVRDNLARFKVPRAVTFLEELPRNPTGKVLKRHLLDLAGPRDVP